MKSKRNYLGYAKRLLSLVLILALMVTTMPSAFFTPVFADEYVQKGRFLVVYEKGMDKSEAFSYRGVFDSEDDKQKNEVKNGKVISVGKEHIALVNDSRMGISSTFRKDRILAIEEDRLVSLLDDEGAENNVDTDSAENNIETKNEQENPENTEVNEDKKTNIEPEDTQEISNSLDKYITNAEGKGIKIALIDSGVNVTSGAAVTLAGGKSFIDDNYNIDDNGHGTSLAGIIKGYELQNGTKFDGLAPNAELYSLKVLNKAGKGYYSDIIKALDWAREENIDVVIMSFGADDYSSILHRSIQKCYFRDMLLVSASGNKHADVKYPAAYTEVMAVGSSFNDEEIVYDYENKDLVEIYAEGQDVNTINSDSELITKKGSSYSTAVAASVCASLWSKDRTLNAREVRGLIKKASKKLNVDEKTYDLLDAPSAEILQDSGEVPTPLDYDSEIKDKMDNNPEVSALAEFTYPPTDTKMWEGFTVGVKFSHNHSKVVAKLILLKDGEELEIASDSVSNIVGGYDDTTNEHTGNNYDFDFKPTYRKGEYRVDFYPYDENGSQQSEWNFSSDNTFNILGADLALSSFIITSSEDIVLPEESLEGTLDVQNIEKTFYADYPEDIKVNFYKIKDNNNNFIYPNEDSIKTMPTAELIDSKDVSKSELLNGNKVDVKFVWKPENKEDVQNYKVFAVIDYKKEYDDVYDNNIAKLACDTTVTFHFPDGSKATLVGDPVDIANGNYTSQTTDMSVAGKVPLEFKRTYNAFDFKNVGLGLHFKHNYNIYYEDRDEYIKAYFADGHIVFFDKNADGSLDYNKSEYTFVGFKDSKFVVEYKNSKTYIFGDNNFIKEIVDKGNTINFAYETYFDENYYNGEKEKQRPIAIASISGKISLTYDADNNLVEIKDNAGRKVNYSFDGKYLSQTTNISGNTYEYKYDDNGRLEKLIDPYGNDQLKNVYDSEGRVIHQINEDGTFYEYEYFSDKTIFTERNGTTSTYYKDEKDRIIKKEYVDGSERFVFDENDNVIRYFDKNGNESNFEYDVNGNLTVSKDALGQVTKYMHNQNGDLTEKENPDGTRVYFGYDENSNLLSITDELGQVQTFVYDNNNNLIESIRKDGSTLSFAYDNRGNLSAESLDGTKLKSYAYDLVNRIIKTTDALGNSTKLEYAPNGSITETIFANGVSAKNIYDKEARLVESIDGKGNSTKYQYNAMGSLLKMESPDSAITTYSYDSMQNLVKTTFADGTEIENVYDEAGRLTKEIDELGNFKTYTYDNNGNILSSIDALGRLTSFDYDELNRLIKTTNPLGDISTITYRYDGKVLSSTDFAGKQTSYDYDLMGRVIKVTTPDGESESLNYDALGNVVSSSDKLERVTEYAYDKRQNLIRVTRPDGTVLNNEYDLNNNLIKSTDAMGNSTSYAYDSIGRLTLKVNALGDKISLEYDNNNNIIKTTDENGHATTYVYDNMNRVVEVIDALNQSEKLEYDVLGRVIKSINKDGSFKTLGYDKKGRILNDTDELGAVTRYEYDKVDSILKVTTPIGEVRANTYDALDRLISMTDPRGNTANIDYDSSGNITLLTEKDGSRTSYSYDIMNRVISEINSIGAERSFTYDSEGNLLTAKDPKGNITSYNYDELNRVTSITKADGKTLSRAYDNNGNIITTTDELGHTKTYTYDALNRLIKLTDELGNESSQAYTSTGKIESRTDKKGSITSYSYDELDRRIKETNALGHQINYNYDSVDNLVEINQIQTIKDAVYNLLPDKNRLEQTSNVIKEHFYYNARKELIKETNALGFSKTYSYDLNGRLISAIDEDNSETSISYDPNGNILTKEIAHPLAGSKNSTITFTYDKMNRMITRSDDMYAELDGGHTLPNNYVYNYDDVGRLVSETDDENKVTSYTYDLNNNITRIKYPDCVTEVAYTYDSMNRITSVEDEDGINSYTYEGRGLRTRLDFANGTHEKYTYDAKGRTLSQVSGNKHNTTMTIHDYEYDANDNITVDVFKNFKTSVIKDVLIKTYAYDALGQLTQEKEQKDCYEKSGTLDKYYYDTVGNRVQRESGNLQTTTQSIFDIQPETEITTYWYNKENQLTMQKGIEDTIAHFKSDSFTFQYDNRGNLKRISAANSYIAQYYYDGTNKLRYSEDRKHQLTRYSYDGLGRRIKKESESNPNLADCDVPCIDNKATYIEDKITIRGAKLELDVKTTQNFVYNPLSAYDDILITYGKNVHTQRFIYGAPDKDKGLIKIDSYNCMGDRWNEDSKTDYLCEGDLINNKLASETLVSKIKKESRYVIKDIRGSLEQLTCQTGLKDKVFEYSAFGEFKTDVSINDIHGYAGYVNDKETTLYYANARMYNPQISKFMSKDILRVDSLNRYLYVVNNPVNAVDLSGLEIAKIRIKDSSLEMIVDTDKQDSVIEMLNMYTNAYEYDDRFLLWGEKGIKAYNYAEEKRKEFNYSQGMSVSSILTSTGVYYDGKGNKDDVKFSSVCNEDGDKTYTITAHNFGKKSYEKMIDTLIENIYSYNSYGYSQTIFLTNDAVERVMRDFNAYKNVDTLKKDENNFKEFVKHFSGLVQLGGNVTKDVNYFRNKLNFVPSELSDLIKKNIKIIHSKDRGDKRDKYIKDILDNNNLSWYKVPDEFSVYHNYGIKEGECDNIKLMSNDGYYEAVFDGQGNLLTEESDARNMGTFNYSGYYGYNPIKILEHQNLDVIPWEKYGTSITDYNNRIRGK